MTHPPGTFIPRHADTRDAVRTPAPRAGGERIRVAHVVTRLGLGGAAEAVLLTVLGLMAHPAYEVDLVAGTSEPDDAPLTLPPGAPAPRLVSIPEMARPISPRRDAVALRRLVRLMRERRYHLVHTHATKAGVLGRVAARMAGVPLVVHSLRGPAFHAAQPAYVQRAIILLERALAARTDHLLSVSERLADTVAARGVVARDRITIVRSGMEQAWFLDPAADPAAARAALGIPPGAPVAGTIARLVPLKGHDLLVDAVPRVVAAVPGVRFLVVGGGRLRPALEARVAALGVGEHVVFTGDVPRERIPEMISAMDVLVHPSLREGLARVLPQALAAGKPCVALDLDGAPEVVIPGETGFLVQPGDVAGLADAVAALLRDGNARRRMGENGRRLVVPAFDVRPMVEGTLAVYERLLRERGIVSGTADGAG